MGRPSAPAVVILPGRCISGASSASETLKCGGKRCGCFCGSGASAVGSAVRCSPSPTRPAGAIGGQPGACGGRWPSRLGKPACAAKVGISWQEVSEGLVQRSWRENHPPPARYGAPRYLGVDGFCVARPRRMWTGLWDLEEGKPLTAVAGEGQGDLGPALEALARPEAVQALSMDLHEPYRQAVHLVLPWAAIVADK